MSHFMSGGYNGGTRKGKPDIAPVMRASFLAALKILKERKGKTLPELMADWLEKDPIAMLNAISKFLPREKRIRAAPDHTFTTTSLTATREFVASVLNQQSVETPSKAIHDRSVAVDPTRRK